MPTEIRTDSTLAAALAQKLATRTAHVGVIGLGYVGLPLAVEFARKTASSTSTSTKLTSRSCTQAATHARGLCRGDPQCVSTRAQRGISSPKMPHL